MTNVDQEPWEESFSEAEPVEYVSEVKLPALKTELVDESLPENPTRIAAPTKGPGWNFAPPIPEVQKFIQEQLQIRSFYPGKCSGEWGNLSVFAIQTFVGGDTVEPDRRLCILIQEYAVEMGGQDPDNIDVGILTPEIWDAFALGLEDSSTL